MRDFPSTPSIQRLPRFLFFFPLLCSVAHPFNLPFFLGLWVTGNREVVVPFVFPASPSSWISTFFFCHVIAGSLLRAASTFACGITVLQPPFFPF